MALTVFSSQRPEWQKFQKGGFLAHEKEFYQAFTFCSQSELRLAPQQEANPNKLTNWFNLHMPITFSPSLLRVQTFNLMTIFFC